MSRLRLIALKASLVALFSVAASLALAVTVVPALGGVVDGNAWLMCIVTPLVIAWPASAVQFWQNERLRDAHLRIGTLHAELAEAHRNLSAAHEALSDKARRDGMTGLLNRESFFEDVSRHLAGSGSGTLLMIDADHFKRINDAFGHLAGDHVLLALAQAIRREAGEEAVVARLGGEEFAVYIAAAEVGAALELAGRIREGVESLRVAAPDGREIRVTVSIGIARCDGDRSLEQLLAETDRQLYAAKNLGRNRTVTADIPAVA